MPLVNETLRNFVGGELGPSVRARSDIKVYANGCERIENFMVETTGPIKYRTGTTFVNNTRLNQVAIFIPFQFSDSQSYLIEMTPGYFRFYKDDGIIVNDEQSITGIIPGKPTIIKSHMHGLNNGDEVFISSMSGDISILNGRSFIVKDVTLDSFALYDCDNTPIDTTGFSYQGDILDGGNSTTNPPDLYTGGNAENNDNIDVDIDNIQTGGSAGTNPINILDGGNTGSNPTYVYDGGNSDNTTNIILIDGSDSIGNGRKIGIFNKIYEITNPYTDIKGKTPEEIFEYLNKVYYTQNTDTMYFVHPKYPPRKLIRSSHTSWEFKEFKRESDYMTGPGKYPGTIAFDGAGRLVYSGFEDEPDLILMSRGPDSKTGEPRYDDFTLGDLANDAIKMYLSSIDGKVMVVKWLTVNNRYFLIGTESGLLRLVPSDGYDNAFSAETLPISKPIDSCGCENIRPVPKGNLLFYFQKGGLIFRCLEYDLVYDSYKSIDKNLVSDVITSSGAKEIVLQSGRPDVLWIPKKNGELIGLTYHETEEVVAWYRFKIGGNGKVLAAGIMPRPDKYDSLWLIVERNINGNTKRYVEFVSDFVEFLSPEDFYTDEDSRDNDNDRYLNDIYERQKIESHLDCCLTYDGSQLGISANASITINKKDNDIAIFTSDNAIFNESDINRQIWCLHKNGIGNGRAEIVDFIDYRNVVCKIRKEFNTNSLSPGLWCITTNRISGLSHLEGETVSIVTDGAVHPERIVKNGRVELSAQADMIHVGYSYRGLIKTTNLNAGGTSGSAQNKPRNVYKVIFELLNSLGVKFGTDLYRLSKLPFRSVDSRLNRPSPLFSGPYEKVFDDKTKKRKNVYIVQDSPLPCTIQAIDVFMEVVDD